MYFRNAYKTKYIEKIEDYKIFFILFIISIIIYTLTFNLSYQEQEQQQSPSYVIHNKWNDISIYDITDINNPPPHDNNINLVLFLLLLPHLIKYL